MQVYVLLIKTGMLRSIGGVFDSMEDAQSAADERPLPSMYAIEVYRVGEVVSRDRMATVKA